MVWRDSLGFWLSMIVVDYMLAFIIAMFCMFSGVDVTEWGRVIVAGYKAMLAAAPQREA